MNVMDKNIDEEVVRWQQKLFTRSIRRQAKLRKIKRLLGVMSNQQCLEISSGDGVISDQLRRDGGNWTTIAVSNEAQAALSYFLKEEIPLLQNGTTNIPDQSMDVVVLVDVLERMKNDHAFIKECHRVLKPDGRLILSVARKTIFGEGGGLMRFILGLSWRRRGLARPGYSARDFFDVLKDGFDVPETESYSTCCIEMPGILCEAFANKLARGPYNLPPENTGTEEFYHYTTLYALGSLIYPLMWFLSKIEGFLLFVMPGHNLAAKTKRRIWRERRTPILVDGRSIAEAALNTKIGTAAPF